MTANVPAPIQVVADYPQGEYGRNLPTGGIPECKGFYRSLLADIDAVLNQQTNIDMSVGTAMLPNGINTCYRQAVLMMLFSLEPFQKMLNAICNDPTLFGPNPNVILINELQNLCSALWDGNSTTVDRERRMITPMSTFWSDWQNRHPMNSANGVQQDASEFLADLLRDIGGPDPNPNSDEDNSNGNYSHGAVFKAMFRNSFIRRSAFGCKCPLKHRYPHCENRESSQWTIPIAIGKEAPTFAEAFARTFYTKIKGTKKTCATCNTEVHEHAYKKFRVPPEVIFFEVTFVESLTSLVRDEKARCDLPDVIDLSLVQDSPGITKRSCKYDLWSVIDYTGVQEGDTTCGHFRCHIHKSGDIWQCVDSNLMRSRGSAKQISLKDIQRNSTFQPRIVAYIRQSDTVSDEAATTGVTVATCSQPIQNSPVTSKPDIVASNTIQLPQTDDSSNWTAKKLTKSLKDRGVAIPAGRQVENLHAAWKHYQANPGDYAQYTAVHLKTKVLDLGLAPDSWRKVDLVKVLEENDEKPSSLSSPPGSAKSSQDRRVSYHTHDLLRQDLENLRRDHAELLKNVRASIRHVEALNVSVTIPTRNGSTEQSAEYHFLLPLPLLAYTEEHWIDPNYTIRVATGPDGSTPAAPFPADADGRSWKVPITVHVHVPGQSIAATDCKIDPNAMPQAICYNRYLQFNHNYDTSALCYLQANTIVKITRVNVTNHAYSGSSINARPIDASGSDENLEKTFSKAGQKFGEKVQTDLKVVVPTDEVPGRCNKRRLSDEENDDLSAGRNVQPKFHYDQTPSAGQTGSCTGQNPIETSTTSSVDYSPNPSPVHSFQHSRSNSPVDIMWLPQVIHSESPPPAPQSGADSGNAIYDVFDTLEAYSSDKDEDAGVDY